MHAAHILFVTFILLAAPVTLAGEAPITAAKLDGHLVEALVADPLEVPIIVTTHGDPGPVADRLVAAGGELVWTYAILDGLAAVLPTAHLGALAADPSVERIYLDRPTAPLMDISSRAIEADKAWSAGIDGTGVTVAVIDTGIDMLHPFFTGAVVACVSTIGGLVSPECTDSDGHGTHVAGTVASRDGNYPGIAPGASLAVVRVLHAVGAGTSSDIIAGMEWVANNKDRVDPPIRVATMSIGFLDPGCGDGTGPEAEAANALVDAGVFFSVAAGNAGHNKCTIDGASAAEKVTTIAAVDDRGTVTQEDDVIADFSSGGGDQLAKPDVAYPGVAITSAFIGAGTLVATLDGTSMATPHAAGTAALLAQDDPSLSATQLKDRITGSAVKTTNTGNSWNSVYGHGLGNACEALGLSTCASGGGGGGGTNSPPTASFTYSCAGLTCDFDGSGSSDSDGSISSYAWDFGDGNTGSGATASNSYAAGGTYTVTLTVTDDGGATDSTSQDVSVSASGIPLSASTYKVRGVQHADLTWSGATSTNVDIYHGGSLLTTTANDGAFTHNRGQKGGGSTTYQVCEAGTSTCSDVVSASW